MAERMVGGLSIFVPRGYGEEGGPQPTGKCHCCNQALYGDPSANVRHMDRCAVEHYHEQRAEKEARDHRLRGLDDIDPERTEHFHKVGKRMLAEGRFTMKKNEV